LIATLIAALAVSLVIKIEGRGIAHGEVRQLGALAVGAPVPTAHLSELSGAPLRLSPVHGRPMLLDFGATWCGPCRALLRPLRGVQRELADLPLDVISIDVGEPAEVVAAHYATRDLGGVHVVLDPDGQVTRQWGIQAFPTLVLVDGRGTVRFIRVGGLVDRDELRERIRKAVAP
jgi:thiol-disulfide isomerase/thioredoxin